MKKQVFISLIIGLSLVGCSSFNKMSCPGNNLTSKDAVVHFAFNSDKLTPVDQEVLSKVSEELKICPYKKAMIVGYTDSTGTAVYNFKLGNQRALSVRDFLIKEGVSSYQIQTMSKGEQDPIGCNSTEEGRLENRRAVIRFE